MSESQSSFVSETQGALEEAMALLEQKGLIIQKYMEKMASQQGRIEQLVQQIERLNWQSREKEYNEQYIRKVSLRELIQQGFVQQVEIETGDGEEVDLQGKQYHGGPAKMYVIRLALASDIEQIRLTEKMELFKDNWQEERRSKEQNNATQDEEKELMEVYCQSVLREVDEMRLKVEKQDSQKDNIIKELRLQIDRLREVINELKAHIQSGRNKLQQTESKLCETSTKLLISEQKRVAAQESHRQEVLLREKQLNDMKQASLQTLQQALKSTSQFLTDQIMQKTQQLTYMSEDFSKERKKNQQVIDQHVAVINSLKDRIEELISEKQGLTIAKDKEIQTLNKNMTEMCEKHSKQLQQKQSRITLLAKELQNLKQQRQGQSQQPAKEQHVQQEPPASKQQLQWIKGEMKQMAARYSHGKREKDQIIQMLKKQNQLMKLQLQQLYMEREQWMKEKARLKQAELQLPLLESRLIQSGYPQTIQQASVVKSPEEVTQIVLYNPGVLRKQTSCQTDPELVFSMDYFTKTHIQLTRKQTSHQQLMVINETNNQKVINNKQRHIREQDQEGICLPPSLEMLGFDFEHSVSSDQQAKLNKISQRMKDSILSSGQIKPQHNTQGNLYHGRHNYNMSQKHHHYQKKQQLSQQVIPMRAMSEESSQSSLSSYQLKKKYSLQCEENGGQMKETQRGKVVSYSEKNVIVEEVDEDEEHHQTKVNYVNVIHHNLVVDQGLNPGQTDEMLIPSCSDLSSNSSLSSTHQQNDLYDNYAQDPILDQALGDSDQPSQTYKNSLRFPNGFALGRSEEKIEQKRRNHNDYYISSQLSKSIGFNLYCQKPIKGMERKLGNKASQLLELKSPQVVMKSLIDKSFPIEKNPFKLSGDFINVAELLQQEKKQKMDYLAVQKNKSSNPGSESLVNIMIESNQRSQDHVQMSTSDRRQSSLRNVGEVTTKQKQPQEKMPSNNMQIVVHGQQGANNTEYRTPLKKNTIELTQSLDFDSLKKIETVQNTKSKKKHKVIYLRR